MEKHKNMPPDGWMGYRNIDEKDAAPSLSFMNDFDDNGDEDDEDEDDEESL
jgi:hypothetical protein